MQAFGVLVLTAFVATSAPVARQDARGTAAPAAEAYVAELDSDWNVTRETRVACPADAGCAVDLALAHAGLAAVHVTFDPMRAGAIAVRSRLEGRDGTASGAEDKTLNLDRTGFAADHYEARLLPGSSDGPIIMMAVRVPGWTAALPERAGVGPT